MPSGNAGTPPDIASDTTFQEQMVKDLESQGVDTTELKAAIASKDSEKVRSIMDGLRDKLPRPSMNGTAGQDGHGPQDIANNSAFQEQMVKDLESKGIDTTELKAAIASKDPEKIRGVMDGLMDKLPRPAMNGTQGKDGKPQGNNGLQEKSGDTTSGQPQQTQQAQPTQTKSPLSPLTILAGIGAAGLAIVSLQRR
ncbi:MAG: hypothetical protein V1862_07995 [Methanobacteriota archaeon]